MELWKTKAFKRWWEEDWSWDGLRTKYRRPHLYFWPSESYGTLQEVWDSERNELIEFAGRRWTRFHLPPVDPAGNVCPAEVLLKAKDATVWNVLEENLKSAAHRIESRSEVAPEVDSSYTSDFVSMCGIVFAEDFWSERKDLVPHLVADFESAVFLGEFSWSGHISVSCRRALFCDKVLARGATFIGCANFEGASFSGECWFSDASFRVSAEFSGAAFSNPNTAFFSHIQFHQGASFNDAAFSSGGCYFAHSNFVSTGFFDRTTFNGADFSHVTFSSPYPAVFRRATFRGYTRFEGTRFGDEAEFSDTRFEGTAEFKDAVFSGEVKFNGAKFEGEASFAGATPFAEQVDYENATFSDDVNFSDRKFTAHTSFARATFGGVPEFYGADLHADTTFAGARLRGDQNSHAMARPRRQWFQNSRMYDQRPLWKWRRKVRDERYFQEMMEAETHRTPRHLKRRRLRIYKYRHILPFALRAPGMERFDGNMI